MMKVDGAPTAVTGCSHACEHLVSFVGCGCGVSSVSLGRVGRVFVASFRACLHDRDNYGRGAATGFVRFFHHVVVVTGGGN